VFDGTCQTLRQYAAPMVPLSAKQAAVPKGSRTNLMFLSEIRASHASIMRPLLARSNEIAVAALAEYTVSPRHHVMRFLRCTPKFGNIMRLAIGNPVLHQRQLEIPDFYL
jgi:hypothetical protein